ADFTNSRHPVLPFHAQNGAWLPTGAANSSSRPGPTVRERESTKGRKRETTLNTKTRRHEDPADFTGMDRTRQLIGSTGTGLLIPVNSLRVFVSSCLRVNSHRISRFRSFAFSDSRLFWCESSYHQ